MGAMNAIMFKIKWVTLAVCWKPQVQALFNSLAENNYCWVKDGLFYPPFILMSCDIFTMDSQCCNVPFSCSNVQNVPCITWDHNVPVAVEMGRSIYSLIRVKQAVMIIIQIELKREPFRKRRIVYKKIYRKSTCVRRGPWPDQIVPTPKNINLNF